MGYKPGKKLYNLTFVDYPGLEINAEGTSIGKFIDLTNTKLDLRSMTDEDTKLKVFRLFADKIVSWNMEHPELDNSDTEMLLCERCGLEEGAPMPSTLRSLLCLDLGMVMNLITGWMSAVSRVAGPKLQSSNGGEMNIEALMSQLAAQQNPLISQTPNLSLD